MTSSLIYSGPRHLQPPETRRPSSPRTGNDCSPGSPHHRPPAWTTPQGSPANDTLLPWEPPHSFSGELTWIGTGLPHRGGRAGGPGHFGIIFRGEGSTPSRKCGPGLGACQGSPQGPGLGGPAAEREARNGTANSPEGANGGLFSRATISAEKGAPRPSAHSLWQPHCQLLGARTVISRLFSNVLRED